jgi:hypothetical protein
MSTNSPKVRPADLHDPALREADALAVLEQLVIRQPLDPTIAERVHARAAQVTEDIGRAATWWTTKRSSLCSTTRHEVRPRHLRGALLGSPAPRVAARRADGGPGLPKTPAPATLPSSGTLC